MTRNDVDKKIFATCLNCMDGRVQLPTIHWIKENYNVDYVDMITEIGMVGALSADYFEIDSIIKKVRFSVEQHNSSNIFVVGHHDCKGNPIDDETHKKQIYRATKRLNRLDLPCKVTGLWLSDEWRIERIIEYKKRYWRIK